MKKYNRSRDNRESEKTINQIQKSLDKIVILLMETKNEPGISQSIKTDIGRAVGELQVIIRELPTITSPQNVLKVVFDAFRKSVSILFRLSDD